ncbi:glycoside hydrolase family 95-like protein, partial [Clavibacter michiganensis]|uniref:glycoside hydrolase family 95-like protein n=1 Tax=Clavibacter michiganensis TaxID=28447 RepID=UPI00374DFCFF
MLLGSDAGSLAVLPALPVAWARGSVTGLRARGGLVVDRLDWDLGELEAGLRAEALQRERQGPVDGGGRQAADE